MIEAKAGEASEVLADLETEYFDATRRDATYFDATRRDATYFDATRGEHI